MPGAYVCHDCIYHIHRANICKPEPVYTSGVVERTVQDTGEESPRAGQSEVIASVADSSREGLQRYVVMLGLLLRDDDRRPTLDLLATAGHIAPDA